jgi:hypothetical protein
VAAIADMMLGAHGWHLPPSERGMLRSREGAALCDVACGRRDVAPGARVTVTVIAQGTLDPASALSIKELPHSCAGAGE